MSKNSGLPVYKSNGVWHDIKKECQKDSWKHIRNHRASQTQCPKRKKRKENRKLQDRQSIDTRLNGFSINFAVTRWETIHLWTWRISKEASSIQRPKTKSFPGTSTLNLNIFFYGVQCIPDMLALSWLFNARAPRFVRINHLKLAVLRTTI